MMRTTRLIALLIVPILLVMQGCDMPTDPLSTTQSSTVTNHDVPQLQEAAYPQLSSQTRAVPMLPTFRWTASALTTSTRRNYQLRVVEIQRGQEIISAFENNAPILDRVVSDSTSLTWPADLPIKPQHTCAWSVRSLDTSGIPTGNNGGGWAHPKMMIPPDPKRLGVVDPKDLLGSANSGEYTSIFQQNGRSNPELPWYVDIQYDGSTAAWNLVVIPDGVMPWKWDVVINVFTPETTNVNTQAIWTATWFVIGMTPYKLTQPSLEILPGNEYQVTISFTDDDGKAVSSTWRFTCR